jgi:hypothetical protein
MAITHHDIAIEILPCVRDRCPADKFFGAETELRVEFTVHWDKYRAEPENGIPHPYYEIRRLELDGIDITIRLHGYEFTVPCKLSDLPADVKKDITDQCHEHAEESDDVYYNAEGENDD